MRPFSSLRDRLLSAGLVPVMLVLAPCAAGAAERDGSNLRWANGGLGICLFALLISWVIFWRFRKDWRKRMDDLARELGSQICIERQLQASQSNLQTATESLGLGTWYWEIHEDRVFCSPEARQLCGLPDKGAYPGAEFLAVVHHDDQERVRETIRKAQAEKGSFHVEFRVTRSEGQVSWVAASGRALADPSGEVMRMTGVFTDVTDRKALEEHLQHARKMEAVGRLAGGIAHDFNNVLSVISAYAELLLEDPDLPAGSGKRVQEIIDATSRANALTRQLLAFSRKQVVAPTVLNLNEVVLGLMSMMQRLVGEDIAVVSSLHSGLPAIKADRGQIEQMLLNFAANSRDAMVSGGRFEIRTSRSTGPAEEASLAAGEYVHLEVIDSGCGMSPDVLDRVFEPFFTTKAVGRGTGLGMATVYAVVQQAGGHISVSSKLNHGTTFHVFLPAVHLSPVAEAVEQVHPAKLSGNVLLVEDEEQLRAVLTEFVESAGMRVYPAGNASHALEVIESGTPIDVLLTDLAMPDTNGRTLARHVRQKLPSVKVIYMSGHTDDDLMRRDLLQEGLPYLQKPFSRSELVKVLENASGLGLSRSGLSSGAHSQP